MAMKILEDYIKNVIITNKLTDEDLENARLEQKQILNELDSLKYELDKLVTEK